MPVLIKSRRKSQASNSHDSNLELEEGSEEDDEDLESGSGETRECRALEMPEEVDPVELDL